MSKHRILFFIGIWVVILPFLGFPGLFKTILFILTGIIIIYISYKEYKFFKKISDVEHVMDSYVESKFN